MFKTFSFICKLTIALALLLITVAIAISFFFDPNDFKPQITKLVAEKIDRKLQIKGDITWSFFPQLAIQVNDITLSNPPEEQGNFLTAKSAYLNLKLLPLLYGEKSIDSINIKSINIMSHTFDVNAKLKLIDNEVRINSLKIIFKGELNGTVTGNINYELDKAVFQANLQSTQLVFQEQKISSINIVAKGNAKNINLKPIVFYIGTGKHTGNVQINLSGTTPGFIINHQALNIDLQSTLEALNKPPVVAGNASIISNLSLHTIDDLNGKIVLNVTAGKLIGIDAKAAIDQAMTTVRSIQAMIKQGKVSFSSNQSAGNITGDNSVTRFSKLSATADIHNGEIQNQDLNLIAEDFNIRGRGKINLVNKTINYNTTLNLTNINQETDPQLEDFMRKVAIPVTISGDLDNPNVRPDMDAYTKKALKHFQQSTLKSILKSDQPLKALKKLFDF